MNIPIRRTLIGLGLALFGAQAMAIPVIIKYEPTFNRVSGNPGALEAKLVVEASTTDAPLLAIGLGYTIKCDTSSLELTAQDGRPMSGFFGVRFSLSVGSTYPMPGYADLKNDECGECTMQHKAEVFDSTNTTMSVGINGVGVNFRLVPTGMASPGNTLLLRACKPPGRSNPAPGTCTP